eukprot:366050-Chlamydomonas_euryale.AAC.7
MPAGRTTLRWRGLPRQISCTLPTSRTTCIRGRYASAVTIPACDKVRSPQNGAAGHVQMANLSHAGIMASLGISPVNAPTSTARSAGIGDAPREPPATSAPRCTARITCTAPH